MDARVVLLTLHGMGETPPDYAEGLLQGLRKRMPASRWNVVLCKSLYYQHILQENQRRVWERYQGCGLRWRRLRKFLLYGLSDAAALEHRAAEAGSVYQQTLRAIRDGLDEVFEQLQGRAAPILLVAHSLGCHVALNYLADSARAAAGRCDANAARARFRRLATLRRLVTTGCNVPLFEAGHAIARPPQAPQPRFAWSNYYDRDDPLGWPMRPLYGRLAYPLDDIAVNATRSLCDRIAHSWNPFNHAYYWDTPRIQRDIAAWLEELAAR